MIDLNSTNLVEINGLTNQATDAYINTATVTGALKDGDGTLLGTLTFTNTATTGQYQGYITTAMLTTVADKDQLTIEITAVSGAYQAFRRFTEQAGYRGRQ